MAIVSDEMNHIKPIATVHSISVHLPVRSLQHLQQDEGKQNKISI